GDADAEGERTHAANGESREDGDEHRRRRRRGRRGGRRNRRPGEEAVERIEANGDASAAQVTDDAAFAEDAGASPEAATAEELHGRAVGDEEPVEAGEPVSKPNRTRRTRKAADADAVVQDEPAVAEGETALAEAEAKP